jgi:hypothetical protein
MAPQGALVTQKAGKVGEAMIRISERERRRLRVYKRILFFMLTPETWESEVVDRN